ncbi:MAG: hypothetical protein O2856_11900 [Planctomycetota bacterium]|nr:hypothetical protein [Planctomycetota bacterium]
MRYVLPVLATFLFLIANHVAHVNDMRCSSAFRRVVVDGSNTFGLQIVDCSVPEFPGVKRHALWNRTADFKVRFGSIAISGVDDLLRRFGLVTLIAAMFAITLRKRS